MVLTYNATDNGLTDFRIELDRPTWHQLTVKEIAFTSGDWEINANNLTVHFLPLDLELSSIEIEELNLELDNPTNLVKPPINTQEKTD